MAAKATKSGNPATRASAQRASAAKALKPTPASAWKTAGADSHDLLLPSGNVARVRRSGPEAFMSQGLIPDPLTAMVETAVHDKKGLPPEKQQEMIDDPEKIGAALEMLDRVLCYAVIEPRVEMPPACEVCGEYDKPSVTAHRPGNPEGHRFIQAERDPDVLYADMVALDDKTFVMNFCIGGTEDLATFRKEYSEAMASLDNGESTAVQAV